jgi:hypothetical protein
MLRGQAPAQPSSGFQQAASPIDLLSAGGLPPTVKGAQTNPRGLNMGGKVNTNIPVNQNYTPEGQMANQASNLQR